MKVEWANRNPARGDCRAGRGNGFSRCGQPAVYLARRSASMPALPPSARRPDLRRYRPDFRAVSRRHLTFAAWGAIPCPW